MKVLLIDDDAEVRDAFARILEKSGFEVTRVDGAHPAFDALETGSFDAIVCDVILPKLDGTTFYEDLAERYPKMAERVLFVTGWSGDDKVIRLLKYTGRPFLNKPVELEDLVGAVREVAELAGASDLYPLSVT